MSKNSKICPNCGRKMKQQFIGLQHCKCGISWKHDMGYFEMPIIRIKERKENEYAE